MKGSRVGAWVTEDVGAGVDAVIEEEPAAHDHEDVLLHAAADQALDLCGREAIPAASARTELSDEKRTGGPADRQAE